MKPSPLYRSEIAVHGVAPSTADAKVEELMRENRALRRQITYFEKLLQADKEVIPRILHLSKDLRAVVCDFNAHIESLNKEWGMQDRSPG